MRCLCGVYMHAQHVLPRGGSRLVRCWHKLLCATWRHSSAMWTSSTLLHSCFSAVHHGCAVLTPAHVPPADASAPPGCPSGCYIGQETISKLHNNNGVKQQLWGVQLSQLCAPGAVVTAEGEKLGKVTSVTDTPDGEFYALAYIKSKSRGAQVSLEGAARPGLCHSLWTVRLMLPGPLLHACCCLTMLMLVDSIDMLTLVASIEPVLRVSLGGALQSLDIRSRSTATGGADKASSPPHCLQA